MEFYILEGLFLILCGYLGIFWNVEFNGWCLIISNRVWEGGGMGEVVRGLVIVLVLFFENVYLF